MTRPTQSLARNSTRSLVWRDDLRVVPKIWDGTAPGPPTLANDFEQFFRLRVLMFGAAIELQIVETAIIAGFGQQLIMRADFFYVPPIHHHDLIGRGNGGKPMGNRDHGFAGSECLQGELNLLLRFGIESRGGFIEKKDGGVLQNRAGDGDPLLLTPGKQHSLVADDSIVLVRLLQDE